MRPRFAHFPVFSLPNRECSGDGFAAGCPHRHPSGAATFRLYLRTAIKAAIQTRVREFTPNGLCRKSLQKRAPNRAFDIAKGDFVWCDLSAFRVSEAKAFYARLFGWTCHRLTQPDGSPYDLASSPAGEAAADFEMPETFQKMGLPSFWMPYVAVDSADAACEQARGAGGKVEVGPVPFSGDQSIALIRDPIGAGITAYQGTGLTPRLGGAKPGHMVWNALYVSDAGAVKNFYEAIFDWQVSKDPVLPGAFRIHNARGDTIAEIQELSDEVRGPFQFWGVQFAVSDVSKARADIVGNSGEIVYEDRSLTGPTTLAKDPDGAAFFIREAGAQERQRPADPPSGHAAPKWKTILGLLLIFVAVLFEQNWMWGVLFILWTIPALRSGETFFVEPISRRANPVLFWLIVATWIGLSVYLVVADLGGMVTSTISG